MGHCKILQFNRKELETKSFFFQRRAALKLSRLVAIKMSFSPILILCWAQRCAQNSNRLMCWSGPIYAILSACVIRCCLLYFVKIEFGFIHFVRDASNVVRVMLHVIADRTCRVHSDLLDLLQNYVGFNFTVQNPCKQSLIGKKNDCFLHEC